MDIDDIEDDINNYEADRDLVLNQVLNMVAHNQAILKTLINSQIALMKMISPELDKSIVEHKINEEIATSLAELQAFLSSHY